MTETEVRFANNGTTTNGLRHNRRVAVVSFRQGADGAMAVGSASASGAVDVEELLAGADADAKASPPAEDAVALVEPNSGASGGASPSFTDAPAETSPSVLDPVIGGLAAAFGRARDAGAVLSGFATHQVASTYLGTSTGLRLRHDQPQGSMELVARSTDGKRSAWAGTGTSWAFDIDLAAFEERLRRRLVWAQRSIELPAGRYEVLLPPDATADLMVAMSQELSGATQRMGAMRSRRRVVRRRSATCCPRCPSSCVATRPSPVSSVHPSS